MLYLFPFLIVALIVGLLAMRVAFALFRWLLTGLIFLVLLGAEGLRRGAYKS